MKRINLLLQPSVMLSVGIIVVVLMLIIELPVIFLDFFMIINIVVGLLIVLSVVFLKKASDFYVFPTLLLATTIFRLAINVSSTRLILTKGQNFEGKLVKAFGEFVIQDKIIVGFVIFIILVIVQFLVITKGASRIAEVAARFTLDKMPGKQMAIDADLNAGIIDENTAKARRSEVDREAEFYGAMDGATKFVSGDVIVGLIITAINIVGGLIVGMSSGMSIAPAFQLFGKFTVGDGLVAQIPTLLISTATGMLVTRAGSSTNIGEDMKAQLFNNPKVLFIVSGFLFFAAFIPGFPRGLLIFISLIFGVIGYVIMQSERESKELQVEEGKKSEEEIPIDVTPISVVDPIEIVIGYNLIPLVDKEQGGDLLERITMSRQQMAQGMGFVVPPIRIRDDVKLGPNDYCINIRGVEVERFSFRENKLLAMITKEISGEPVEGEEVLEPAFKMKAIWIDEDKREQAESLAYTVVDLPTIIATHLTEVIKRNSGSILGREDVKKMIEHLKETQPALIEEFAALKGYLGLLQKIMQNLLSEGISIRDLVTIVEKILDYQNIVDIDILTERVRHGLSRQISNKYATINGSDENKIVYVVTIAPELDMQVGETITETEEGLLSTLDAESIKALVDAISKSTTEVRETGKVPIVLCSAKIRTTIKQITRKFLPFLDIISYQEIADGYQTESMGIISL